MLFLLLKLLWALCLCDFDRDGEVLRIEEGGSDSGNVSQSVRPPKLRHCRSAASDGLWRTRKVWLRMARWARIDGESKREGVGWPRDGTDVGILVDYQANPFFSIALLSTLDLSLDFHLPQTDILLTFGLRCEMTLHFRLFRTASAPWVGLLTSNEMLGYLMVTIW